MTGRELCIALNMITGVGYSRYKSLLDVFSSADEIRKASRGELQKIEGIGNIIAERISSFDWDAELTREYAIAERGQARIVTLVDEDYPEDLRQLWDPPLCLYIRGKLPENSSRSVAIVGSRRISAYGEKMAKSFAGDAARSGFTVYSGLALGVDTIAHKSAVECGAPTIGVLGCGLMHMYPKGNIQLAREIIRSGGAVISEFPLNYPVNRFNFPRRNRIVAALTQAVIVIEAGVDSGSLITAHLAAELGKDVFALPGRVDNVQARGCHKLIKEGAALAEDFSDVAAVLKAEIRPSEVQKQTELFGLEELSPDCQNIYNVLKKRDAALEDLLADLKIDAGTLLANLMQLEIKGMIEKDAAHIYHLI